jgi:Na+/H+ antiporter NhaD/arsenite permease-like protein
MASTLAGNFTLVGSVANPIVAQRARAEGVAVGFREYFKVGAPLTVLTILLAAVRSRWIKGALDCKLAELTSEAAGTALPAF